MNSLLVAVPIELQLVCRGGMDAELRTFAAAHPLGPGIAQERVGQQAEVIGLARLSRHVNNLGAEAGTIKVDTVGTRSEVGMDGPGGPRPCLDRGRSVLKLQQHVAKCEVTLIADIADQHRCIPRLADSPQGRQVNGLRQLL